MKPHCYFFSGLGELDLDTIPAECVRDCAASGRDAAPYIRMWREHIGFSVPQTLARRALRSWGAWDDLGTASDETIAERVLWLACWEIRENGPDAFFILEG